MKTTLLIFLLTINSCNSKSDSNERLPDSFFTIPIEFSGDIPSKNTTFELNYQSDHFYEYFLFGFEGSDMFIEYSDSIYQISIVSREINNELKAYYHKVERHFSEIPMSFDYKAESNIVDTNLIKDYLPLYTGYEKVQFDSIYIDFERKLINLSFFKSIKFE